MPGLTVMPLSVSLWKDLSVRLCPDGVGLAGYKSRFNISMLTYSLSFFRYFFIIPFMIFLGGVGIFKLIDCARSQPPNHEMPIYT